MLEFTRDAPVPYSACYNRILAAITLGKEIKTYRVLNTFVAMPIRSGKTTVSKKLVYDLVEKGYTKIGYCVSSALECNNADFSDLEEVFISVKKFTGSQIRSKSLGVPFEIIIVDEAESFSNESIIELNKMMCQKVYLFTPNCYNPRNPTELKNLWDTSLAFKFQLTGHDLGFEDDQLAMYYSSRGTEDRRVQTQVECNWFAENTKEN